MDPIERYNKLLLNTVMEDYNNVTRSKLIKKLLESEIASKKKKDVDAVYIVSIAQKEKFRQCLEKTRNTIKDIELLEINKGYKYSIPYKINNVNFEKLSEFAINVEKYNWNEFKEEDISKPVYIDNEHICAIKFHKEIDCIDSDSGKKVHIRYPLLMVINKKYNILEYRFDRIIHKKDDVFYSRTIDGISDYCSKLNLDIVPYELGAPLAEIVKNYPKDAEEEVCSMGFPGEKGVIVKYGKNRTMPVLGELEELVQNNEDIFGEKAKEIIDGFIFEKKVLSSKHYREIKWLNNAYNGNTSDENKKFLKTKIIFNYKGKHRDLIDFHYSNLNDMERMNNVIEFIDKINNNIKKG
ncbi:hypothetical protein [Clostridium paraputrificum]|uniref:hypothetical protein n=1 Tax=Clostridium paraputrificum TaxID=29363 RepID=UPI002FCD8668